MLKVLNVKVPLNTEYEQLINIVVKKTGIKKDAIKSFKIAKKSIDARNKEDVHFVYSFDIELSTNEHEFIKHCKYKTIDIVEKPKIEVYKKRTFTNIKRPIIIGSGPAGLFAALVLAEIGMNPIVIERGKEVSERKKDVDLFWKTGKLNVNSNVQFGEGGAGTFSDGKLTTGTKDKLQQKVLNEFINSGANEKIAYETKPHIGTDKLLTVVKNLREKIISFGGEFKFETRLEDFYIENNKLTGIKVSDNNHIYDIETDKVILAIGHSARDTFEMIYNMGIKIIQKPFSIGARIEHSQEMINKIQYGKFANNNELGAADYKLAEHLSLGRSVYTFCMCPGGLVVSASSEENRLVVNGMSEYARDKQNANSALLVGINPKDFGSEHPLQGMYLQRNIEELAFKAGGSNYNAPIQLVGDFLNKKPSTSLGNIIPSYTPNIKLTTLDECLPEYITDAMREAISIMDKKLKGFATYDAVLTGVETRSSSPIRILRNENFLTNIWGIYSCGEGSGYSGGIMSSAVDGIKCANSIINLIEK